ncbi:MAG: ATP-binding protein [Gammaproteobacteria bacterium]|nr:ATP-binding protein [Gammaproteobacteria bacterium]
MAEQYKFIREPIIGTALLLFVSLTSLVGFSLYWNIDNLYKEKVLLAIESARTNWNKDQAFRGWATRHGGLYVKPDKRTPPSPYLAHLPDRDVVTTTGQKLTLMNPAYMMSQMTREYEETYGVKGRITGKVQLNPANSPDAWEWDALTKFENGVDEVIEQSFIEGMPFVRLMKPMYMKPGCVKCHGHLGFEDGDLRGGVSVSIPLRPYYVAADATRYSMQVTHGMVWAFGVIALVFYVWMIRRRESGRRALEAQITQQNIVLAHARDEALRSSQAKSEFLSLMSHELRTPLNAILGNGQLLELDAENLSENQMDGVKDILGAGRHLLNLVNEVLDLARIESGKMEVNMEPVPVAPVIEQCISLIKKQASERDISVTNNMDGSDYSVVADMNRFKQVMLNLLSNAVKYNKQGGSIFIDVNSVGKNSLRVSVTDTGRGLTEEQMGRLFTSFDRLGVDDIQEGTGIGLVISKRLVELMAGSIDVQSTAGSGSVFSVELKKTES